jgi:hypothetical protein
MKAFFSEIELGDALESRDPYSQNERNYFKMIDAR